MNLQAALDHRSQVEQSLLKHRTGLLNLLLTDTAGSTQLQQGLGDPHAVLNLQCHHASLLKIQACIL